VCPYDIDRFLNPPTTGHDVFDDDKLLIRRNLETAAQDKFALIFFDKNVAFAKRASDFLADNNPAESRGNHPVTVKLAQFFGQRATNFCGNVGMLEQQRALEILATVQTGAQDKVAIKKCAGFAKEREKIFANDR